MSQALEAPTVADNGSCPHVDQTLPVARFRTQPLLIAAFAGTIFLSAFLLFQVQPLLSKFILPWFGGSPAVWTGAMLFFQLVLFAGYVYAHFLSKCCSTKQRMAIHLAVLLLAASNVAWGRLIPPEWLRPHNATIEHPLQQVLLLLGMTVGLPYFALSSTGPLLQRWFYEALAGYSPYRLFALSNLGSLLALVSYPFFFEVQWGVSTQAQIWSAGYLLFVGGCAFCAVRTWQTTRPADKHGDTPVAAQIAARNTAQIVSATLVPPKLYAYWLGLATLASVMFLAVTNEVCQNVASVPLLWVAPLSLYLLTFVIAFDHARWYSRTFFAVVVLALVVIVVHYDFCLAQLDRLLRLVSGDEWGLSDLWWLQAGICFLMLSSVATLCHGELARSRPAAEQLTSFYLTMSLGGALGGLLVNLAAPVLFRTFLEFPLGLMLSAGVAAAFLCRSWEEQPVARRLVSISAVAAALIAVGGLVAAEWRPADPAYQTVFESRNFYGVVSVMHRAIGDPAENYTFYSGNVQHGRQLADPARRHTPLTYYGEGSGCEAAFRYVQSQKSACRIGGVGLGVGTIATYARPTDSLRLYEINPEVIRIARDQRWFHYVSDCACEPEIVLGDARVQLERELRQSGGQKFDILIIDAFSGDSVPTHLLTKEAFEIYLQHLQPDGLLVLHITNTHLDLYPVVSQLAEELEMSQRRVYRSGDPDRLLYRNYYFIASRNDAFRGVIDDRIAELPEYLRRERTVPLWTDEYTNLTTLLR